MNTKKAVKNFIYSVLSQIVTICLGLAVPRLILLGYGSETNGLLGSVTQMILYLNLFESGIHSVAMQSLYKPVNFDDKKAISRILSAVHLSYRKIGAAYLGVLLLLAAIYPLFLADSDLQYWSVFAVVLFSGLGNVIIFFFQGKYKILLQAEGKNYILTNLQTIISVLNNMGKIICILLGCDIVVVVAVSFLISLIQAAYICTLMSRKYSWIDLKSTPDYGAIAQKNSALVHELAAMVFQNTDVLILTVFCGLKVVSVYSIYKLVTSHLSAVLRGLYASISFALGQKFNTDRPSFLRMIDAVDVYFGGLCFAFYAVAAALFLPFVQLYTQGVTDIPYADRILCLLFVAVELLTFLRMPMLNTINYAGHFKNTLPQTLLETAINLAVSLTSVRYLGIYGVLLGTVAALAYRDIDILLYTNHKILNRTARKTFCIYGVDIIIFALVRMGVNAIRFRIESYTDFIGIGLLLTPVVIGIYMLPLSIFFSDEKKVLRQAAKRVFGRGG